MRPAARRRAPDSAKTGLWGERVAADWLAKAGYSIVGRRVRPAFHDEIDIVATKGRILAFVEVKARTSEVFERPASAVGREKRKTLCRAAAAYLRRAAYPNMAYRFDIIEVIGRPDSPAPPTIRHIPDAFRFPLRYRFARQGATACPHSGFAGFIAWLARHFSRRPPSAAESADCRETPAPS